MSVHYISDRSLMRDGYAYEETPDGAFVGVPVSQVDDDYSHRSSIVQRLMGWFKQARNRRLRNWH